MLIVGPCTLAHIWLIVPDTCYYHDLHGVGALDNTPEGPLGEGTGQGDRSLLGSASETSRNYRGISEGNMSLTSHCLHA